MNYQLLLRQAPWPLHPTWTYYYYGTCTGALRFTPGTIQILVVENLQPGNGDFGKLLDFLHEEAQRRQSDVLILQLHNQRLRRHLLEKRGYQAVEYTPHVLLPVAGPGECPAEVVAESTTPATVMDRFLDQLLDAFTHPHA